MERIERLEEVVLALIESSWNKTNNPFTCRYCDTTLTGEGEVIKSPFGGEMRVAPTEYSCPNKDCPHITLHKFWKDRKDK